MIAPSAAQARLSAAGEIDLREIERDPFVRVTSPFSAFRRVARIAADIATTTNTADNIGPNQITALRSPPGEIGSTGTPGLRA